MPTPYYKRIHQIRWEWGVRFALLIMVLLIAAAGLTLALKETLASPTARIKTPYWYAVSTTGMDLKPTIDQFFGPKGDLIFPALPANQPVQLLSPAFYQRVNQIEAPMTKTSPGLVSDNYGKHALGLVNDIWIVIQAEKQQLVNKKTVVKFDIRQFWNQAGNREFTIKFPADLTQGTNAQSQTALFNGALPVGTALNTWHFSKSTGLAKPDGTDADYAWFFNRTNGAILLISKAGFQANNLLLYITEATRFMHFQTRAVSFRSMSRSFAFSGN